MTHYKTKTGSLIRLDAINLIEAPGEADEPGRWYEIYLACRRTTLVRKDDALTIIQLLQGSQSSTDPRIEKALTYARRFGGIDGAHHKLWVIDQMVRALTGCPVVTKEREDIRGRRFAFNVQGESDEYRRFVARACDGEDGPNTYEWDTGIAP